MAIGSGIAGQFGFVEESVWGTPVTVSRFAEFAQEAIKTNVAFAETKAIRGSQRVQRADRNHVYVKDAHGSITIPVTNKNLALLFVHALGAGATPVTTATSVKTFSAIPGTSVVGKGLTVQIGRPDTGGTVRAFTYEGGKIVAFELNIDADGALMFVPEFDFQTLLVGTALASASYVATQENLYYDQGALTVGGSAVTPVKSFKLKVTNAMKQDRRGLGNVKFEPLFNGEQMIEGTIECEFTDRTQYDAFVAGTNAALVLTFTTATTIPSSSPPTSYSVTVTIPLIQYREANPNVSGPDVLKQSLNFKGLDDGTNPPITIAIATSDAAA